MTTNQQPMTALGEFTAINANQRRFLRDWRLARSPQENDGIFQQIQPETVSLWMPRVAGIFWSNAPPAITTHSWGTVESGLMGDRL